MPISNFINGVWRDSWVSAVNINGVWRNNDTFANVNGVWKSTGTHFIKPDDVIGFRLVYKCNLNKTYDKFGETIVTNLDLPIRIGVTGESHNMDYTEKGIVLSYEDGDIDNGLVCFEGTLYAELIDGKLINVSLGSDVSKIDTGLHRILIYPNAYDNNKMQDISISMDYTLTHECYGYHTVGWNSMFNDYNFLDDKGYWDKFKDHSYMEYWDAKILPIDNRADNYRSFASVGIIKYVEAPNRDNRSSGYLSQAIMHMRINGIEKPFIVEAYV